MNTMADGMTYLFGVFEKVADAAASRNPQSVAKEFTALEEYVEASPNRFLQDAATARPFLVARFGEPLTEALLSPFCKAARVRLALQPPPTDTKS